MMHGRIRTAPPNGPLRPSVNNNGTTTCYGYDAANPLCFAVATTANTCSTAASRWAYDDNANPTSATAGGVNTNSPTKK